LIRICTLVERHRLIAVSFFPDWCLDFGAEDKRKISGIVGDILAHTSIKPEAQISQRLTEKFGGRWVVIVGENYGMQTSFRTKTCVIRRLKTATVVMIPD